MFKVCLVLLTGLYSLTSLAGVEENRKTVLDFYDLAFNQHQPVLAAERYLSEEYVQHNPHAGTGRAAFIKAFKDAFKDDKDKRSKNIFKRTIVENDLVVLHSHQQNSPDSRGVAVVDIFRVKNGKITEHWDVSQAVPTVQKNNNTMF